MSMGPQEARFSQALDGADAASVADQGAAEWLRCRRLLQNVAMQLQVAANNDKGIQGRTGKGMGAAFTKTAQATTDKADELLRGHDALQNASNAIKNAHTARTQMNSDYPAVADPGPKKTLSPDDAADPDKAKQVSDHNQAVDTYQTTLQHREAISQKWADHIDSVYADSTATMKSISGYQDPPPPPGGGGGGNLPTSGNVSWTASHQNAGTGHHTTLVGGTLTSTHHQHHHQPPTVEWPPVPPNQHQPPTGGPQGPGDPGPGGHGPRGPVGPGHHDPGTPGLPGTPSDPGGDGGSPGIPVNPATLGTGAAAVLGGAGIANLLRNSGGLSGLAGNLSSRGAGPIGGSPSSVRTAGSSVLGRGSGSAASEAEGTTSGNRTGAAGGGRGGAGGRSGGAGGAGGRGKKDKRGKKGDRDLFDDGQDWLDDEGAAPGVLD